MMLNLDRHLAHRGARKHGATKGVEHLVSGIRSGAVTRRNLRIRDTRSHQELLLASELQSELLPALHPPEARIDLGAKTVAARMVGGDFYDFYRYPCKAISAETIGDVSGKGAAAAIYAGLVTGILRSLAPLELGPGEMLSRLNSALLKRPVRGRYVSLIYATWDERERLFRIANAGLPYPVWVRDGKASSIKVAGLPLGLFEEAEYEEHTLACGPGDLVVFYTDGVTEAINRESEDFGAERLEEVISTHAGETADRVVSAIFFAVASHAKGLETYDDQTVIAVRT
jgi:sigma-B regulation protein RsbU (phosphoserine phosphatase)